MSSPNCKPRLHDPDMTEVSRGLRRDMTEHERKLWYCFLKGLPETVSRQKKLGRYVADFCIASHKLIIELDGAQHRTEDGLEADRVRDAFLRENGYTVVRYSNADVNFRFESVCRDILKRLGRTQV